MPGLDVDKIKSSWAAQMEDEIDEDLGERQVEQVGNTKIITEYKFVDGKKVKIVRHYRTEKRKVSKNVAKRKMWTKFGLSANDPPGPNTATTIMSDEIKMEFLSNNDDENNEKDPNNLLKEGLGNPTIQCRRCGLNHWTLQCPYKDQLEAIGKPAEASDPNGKVDDRNKGKIGFGSIRDGKRFDLGSRSKDENNTIRITNLPEETQDSDIRDLFNNFGRITRIFLAKDKATGNSKGFAFVSFESRENAARAIKTVNGHGYNNLILNVEWARPSVN